MYKLVLGHILNPISDKKLDQFADGAMLLKRTKSLGYKILRIGTRKNILKYTDNNTDILDYSGQLIIPSFFDMHFHWVQDDVRKMPKANLLDWLNNYTFPAEEKFKNKAYAKKKAQVFFERLVSTGTLGGACYSSIHEHALDYAQQEAVGDFVIGNVLMTMNSPRNLTQSPQEAISLVKKCIKKYKKNYCLTPRFAIATDPVTMKETAKMAKAAKCFMQSHLSETNNEIEFVKSLYKDIPGFEKIKTYSEIYHKTGMLGPRSIMGHGIHLQASELKLLSKTKTSIAHCPTSNAPIKQLGLGSGLFQFKTIEKHKIDWALGSDIGGGPYVSMFDVMHSFVTQNKSAKVSGASYTKALYRATLAGASILQMDKKKGNLSPGKEANFIVLNKTRTKLTGPAEKILANLHARGSKKRSQFDQFPQQVFYQGNLVHQKSK